MLLLPLLFPFLIGCTGQQPVNRLTSLPEDNFNFIIANDLGRNGYYLQKPIAETMGNLAETVDIEFVAAAGEGASAWVPETVGEAQGIPTGDDTAVQPVE